MDKELIEKYKREMLKVYAAAKPEKSESGSEYGEMEVIVTALKGLYPVSGAVVTVFKEENGNQTVIDSDITDLSGNTKKFLLPAPNKENSQTAENTKSVYSEYGISVTANGFVEQINLNIPVFSGVTSLQRIDLVPISASNGKGPTITNEHSDYNL